MTSDTDRTQEPVLLEHAQEVCKIGQGNDCCRYLTMGRNGFSCEKNSSLATMIDTRVGQMVAKADNCEGRLSR